MDNHRENCQNINKDQLQFLESIGKGSFGVVYKALWKGLTVAVKKVETESEVNAFHNEVQQLARVQHDNIIQLYGACMSDAHKFLVIEFADGGSLYHLLHSSPNTDYNLAHGISWLLQCAKAVSYLHAIQPRPLLHRDLKPPNLLLTKGAKVLKVCDFGTACEYSTIMSDNRGSAAWMAPEVFEGKLYTEKCDVYSWGIILWEVMTRRVPFEDLGLAVRIMWAVHQNQRPPLITGCPKSLENLMKRCWDHDHRKRPQMEEVVEKVALICRFLKGAEEPIHNPPSDDSVTDSYMSPCIGSSVGHTSRDVSELSYSTTDIAGERLPHRGISNTSPSTLPNEGLLWRSEETEETYPMRDSSGSCTPQPPPPAISPNVSSTVLVGPENLASPWSTAHSEDLADRMQPLVISIPNAEHPTRSDITVTQHTPAIAVQPSYHMPLPIGSLGGISPNAVPMRRHLTTYDPQAYLRRRSEEVTPQPTSYREGGQHGHRRSSSFGSGSVKSGGEEESKSGDHSSPLPASASQPTNLHIPNYHIDPFMRVPGGSLGGVEGALKYHDIPLPRAASSPSSPSAAALTSPITSTAAISPSSCTTPTITTSTPTTPSTTTTIVSPSTSAATTMVPAWLPYPVLDRQFGGVSHNGEGGGGGGGGGTEGGGTGDGTEEEDLGAFWELLDNELRPIKPLPSCPESQSIFSEHKEMARKYLVLQQEIFNLRKRKAGLEEKLSQAEKLEQLGNQRYQDKIRELENKRENLRHNHSRLRRQLEQIRMRQAEQQQQEQQEDGSEGCPGHNLPLAPP